MNILGYTEPIKLLEALEEGEILEDFWQEIGDAEDFNEELEKEFCEPCNENQCNHCPLYVIQTKYLD